MAPPAYEHIVFGLADEASPGVLRQVAALAARLGARVTVVGVSDANRDLMASFTLDNPLVDVGAWLTDIAAGGQARVDRACAALRQAGVAVRGEYHPRGHLTRTLCARARRLGADLIVLPPQPRRGLRRLLPGWLGSPLQDPPCAVLILPHEAPDPAGAVLEDQPYPATAGTVP